MKWLLMWLNVSVATLNGTLQLLVIYRCRKGSLLKDLLMRLLPHQFQCKRCELYWTNHFQSYFGVLITTKSTL